MRDSIGVAVGPTEHRGQTTALLALRTIGAIIVDGDGRPIVLLVSAEEEEDEAQGEDDTGIAKVLLDGAEPRLRGDDNWLKMGIMEGDRHLSVKGLIKDTFSVSDLGVDQDYLGDVAMFHGDQLHLILQHRGDE